jgi:hypothetical protein
MKRHLRGGMPLAVTLPLHFDLGLRAAGVWLPAKAALGNGSAAPGARGVGAVIDHGDPPLALKDLAIGDDFTLRRHDGAMRTFEVIALDVVDSQRVEFEPDGAGQIVALTTPWPFDGTPVGEQWHYVVTVRLRF